VFEELLNNYGIKKKNPTPFNPQSNGSADIDGTEINNKDPWGPFLSSSAYAIHSTFHTKLKATPGQILFGRDMVLPIKFMADWGKLNNNAKHKWAVAIEDKMPSG
jgi:hypothetical protein